MNDGGSQDSGGRSTASRTRQGVSGIIHRGSSGLGERQALLDAIREAQLLLSVKRWPANTASC